MRRPSRALERGSARGAATPKSASRTQANARAAHGGGVESRNSTSVELGILPTCSELLAGQVVVQSPSRHQFVVRAMLDDPALLEHDDESAFRIVLNRWAITIEVRPPSSGSMFSWIARSDSVSSALVASSRIRIGGRRRAPARSPSRCR